MTCLHLESQLLFSLIIAIKPRILRLIRYLSRLITLFLHDHHLPGLALSNLPDLDELPLNLLSLLLPPLSLHPAGDLPLAGLLRHLPRPHPLLSEFDGLIQVLLLVVREAQLQGLRLTLLADDLRLQLTNLEFEGEDLTSEVEGAVGGRRVARLEDKFGEVRVEVQF